MKIEETRCFWDMILLSEESFDIFDKKYFSYNNEKSLMESKRGNMNLLESSIIKKANTECLSDRVHSLIYFNFLSEKIIKV